MSFAPRSSFQWLLRTRSLALGERTLIMGILNVTPDSFSDGGRFAALDAAVAHALDMLDHGADMVDLGGESTRPNATPIAVEEEQRRVVPVIQAILRERPQAVLSVDTFHAATARAAIAAGAEIVNDVSGLHWDEHMPATCAEMACGTVLMHARGTPQQWSSLLPLSRDEITPTVVEGLEETLTLAERAGIARERIVLDPGIGFGKRGDENYTLLAHLSALKGFNLPILVGLSRKGFLGQTVAEAANLARVFKGVPPAAQKRLSATIAGNVAAILAGAHIVRVHDVQAAAEAAAIADSILRCG